MRRQMSDKGSRGRSGRAPQTVHEDAIIYLSNPSPSGFSVLHRPDGPRLRPDGPCLVSDGARFSFGRSVVLTSVFAVFLSEAHPGVANGPRLGVFPKKKLLMSGIIYGVLDNRFRIVVDELMHL